MTALLPTFRAASCAALGVLGLATAAPAQQPAEFHACVTPLTGLLYQPREPGRCFHSTHRPISWTDGAGAFPAASALGGDLAGTLPAPTVTGLQGRPVSAAAPAANDVLRWDGTSWTPGAVASAGIIESPNGQYSLRVTDDGIELHASDGSFLKFSTAGIEVRTRERFALNSDKDMALRSGLSMELRSGTTMRVDAGTSAELRGGTTTTIRGPISTRVEGGNALELVSSGLTSVNGSIVTVTGNPVLLNGAATACPVARLGSTVQTSTATGTGTVTSGTNTVLVGC